ncbi:hypothetical protein MRB53_011908 [Persea americana]|uniref:Uncharacterized protein n=1 Tax=Persea americana TaxID=3435 RepID=A0ACC2LX29_PERAE|nr:hypothetical protein MRB53_011908 [Persea americana]
MCHPDVSLLGFNYGPKQDAWLVLWVSPPAAQPPPPPSAMPPPPPENVTTSKPCICSPTNHPGEDVEEVSETTEDDEGTELEEDPSKGEDGGVGAEVEELETDGEVGEGDKEVTPFLALEDVVKSLEGLSFFICADAAREGEG